MNPLKKRRWQGIAFDKHPKAYTLGLNDGIAKERQRILDFVGRFNHKVEIRHGSRHLVFVLNIDKGSNYDVLKGLFGEARAIEFYGDKEYDKV
jgi:hypothetical protein